MEIAGGSRGCYAINSSFRILEIGPLGNHPSKFAADFEQTCAGDQAPLYGSIRYNSAVPVTIVPFTSFTAASGAGWAGVTTSLLGGGPSCRFDNPHWLPPPPGTGDVPPSKPASDTVFPQGLLAFALDGCTRGAAVTITIRFPFTLPPGLVYWKYGPTVDNRAPHWYVVPAIITSNSVMFNIVDGGFGDDDLTVNGRIVDAGGLGTGATPPPPPVPPSAAGAATQIPTLSEAAVVALTLLLLSAGLLAIRRRTRDLRR